jgi:hypothetical protein
LYGVFVPNRFTFHAVACAQLALALVSVPSLSAQSTFDGDITAAGHHQYAIDALSYVAPTTAGGWLWLNPRAYKGLAHNLELGAGVSYYSHPAGGTTAFQPSVKWRAARDTVHRLTLSVGAQSLMALSRNADNYGLAFVSIDSRVHQSERAAGSISVGTYTLVARDASASDDRRGLTLTAWEAIGPVRLSGSWLSGTNFYGYKTGTVTYTATSGRWFSVGYSQGNAAWHNAGPYVSTGRAF